eukprot:63229-Rhodomonas_salina.5
MAALGLFDAIDCATAALECDGSRLNHPSLQPISHQPPLTAMDRASTRPRTEPPGVALSVTTARSAETVLVGAYATSVPGIA